MLQMPGDMCGRGLESVLPAKISAQEARGDSGTYLSEQLSLARNGITSIATMSLQKKGETSTNPGKQVF